MTKISFDFDNTLEFEHIQQYAKELIEKGFEIHIVTTRYEDTNRYSFSLPEESKDHKDLYTIAEKLGILRSNIHFTNMGWKHFFFQKNTFLLHLDDNDHEVDNINHGTKTKAVDALSENWKAQCEKILKT